MSITRSAIERPKNRCVTMTGVMAANGITSSRTTSGSPSRRSSSPSSPAVVQRERGLVVALVIHGHVVLGDADEPARGVEPVVALPQRRFVDGVARLLLDRVREHVGRQLLDLLAVVALGDELRLGAKHVVKAVIR